MIIFHMNVHVNQKLDITNRLNHCAKEQQKTSSHDLQENLLGGCPSMTMPVIISTFFLWIINPDTSQIDCHNFQNVESNYVTNFIPW